MDPQREDGEGRASEARQGRVHGDRSAASHRELDADATRRVQRLGELAGGVVVDFEGAEPGDQQGALHGPSLAWTAALDGRYPASSALSRGRSGRASRAGSTMKDKVLIANGQGFWGDSILGPIRLLREGPLDHLTLDYLAVTMSIMQKLRSRKPDAGYATTSWP